MNEYILLDDAAKMLNVTRNTLNKWCASGILAPAFGKGSERYTERAPVIKMMKERSKMEELLTMADLSELTGLTVDILRRKKKRGVFGLSVIKKNCEYFSSDCVDLIMADCGMKVAKKENRIQALQELREKKKEKKAYTKPDDDIWKCEPLEVDDITDGAFIRFGGWVIRSVLRDYEKAMKNGRDVSEYENWMRGPWFQFYSASSLDPEYLIRLYRKKFGSEKSLNLEGN